MVTLLITSFLLLAGITYVVYLWQRPSSQREADFNFPPPRAVGLFDAEAETLPPRELPAADEAEAKQRQALLARAKAGDKEALYAAQAFPDAAVYDEVLNHLVETARSDKALFALASYIARSDAKLRVNRRLAEKFIESWQSAPDRNSTAQMLHVAALGGDAGLYQTAIETAFQFWRDGRLTGISPNELRQLIESEFWILAPPVRNSGAGFVLKRKLAQLRRQLVPAAKRSDG
jgi:hypothetical protein